MNNNSLVSIVVATYKRDLSLRKALESLINQTYKNIEIIVVDDNSNEEWNKKVKEIIDDFINKSNIIYIKNEKNKGSAQTRNIGIEKANGEYITFLDDDDIYLPNKILNQLNKMKEYDADFSVTDLELLSENGKIIEKRTRGYINKIPTTFYSLLH